LKKKRKLLTKDPKVDINRLYIKRQSGGRGMVEMESAYNAAIVGLCKYIKQGEERFTRSVQEYDAKKTKYSLQKQLIS
jgi:hypothetical protein